MTTATASKTQRAKRAGAFLSGKPGAASLRGKLSPRRIAGYALYSAWVLITFYNTVPYNSSFEERDTLNLNMLVSMAFLTLTMLALPLMVRNADRRVLSRSYTYGAGTVMALSTLLLFFANTSDSSALVITVLSAALTGISSGTLLLGWCRNYADVGPRPAMAEMSLAWIIAGAIDILVSVIPGLLGFALTVAIALASALLLRRSTFERPARPAPSRDHALLLRTRRIFARALVGCLLIGSVAGYSNVLAGFSIVEIPRNYEILLAVSIMGAVALVLVTVLLSSMEYMRNVRRLIMLVLTVSCLLCFFTDRLPTLGNICLFGAYEGGLTIMLCAICIDVSNYFDQPATRTFGLTFFFLYLGETIGNTLAQNLVAGTRIELGDVAIMAFVMTLIIVIVSIFLFTESDLIETSVGEMTGDEISEEALERTLAAGVFGSMSARPIASGDGLSGGANAGAGAGSGGSGGGTAGAAGGVMAGGSAGGLGAAGTSGIAFASGEAGAPQPRGEQQATIEELAAELALAYGLTAREAEVLPLVLRGRTIARIMEELHISQGTVSTHIRHIYQKMGVHNRQELLDMMENDASSQE